MAASSDVTFFVGDTEDGKVVVLRTLPTGSVIEGPLQMLRVTGPGVVTPPKSPMSQQEFTAWREGLEDAGLAVDLRFVD